MCPPKKPWKNGRTGSLPVSWISTGRTKRFSCSNVLRWGERPPWQQKILFSIKAATGIQLNTSWNIFHIFTLNRRLPKFGKGKFYGISWNFCGNSRFFLYIFMFLQCFFFFFLYIFFAIYMLLFAIF